MLPERARKFAVHNFSPGASVLCSATELVSMCKCDVLVSML